MSEEYDYPIYAEWIYKEQMTGLIVRFDGPEESEAVRAAFDSKEACSKLGFKSMNTLHHKHSEYWKILDNYGEDEFDLYERLGMKDDSK